MSTKENTFKNLIGKNGRALGSLGYFIILMLVFLIGAPEVMMRPNLHQSVFVMLPVIMFMVIPLVFLVTAGEIDLSFASTFGLSAYIFALLLKAGIDPLLCILIQGELFFPTPRNTLYPPLSHGSSRVRS